MSSIEWTDRTWNVVRGCSRISEGCRNCYAERMARRLSAEGFPYHGFAEAGRSNRSAWTGRVELIPEKLDEPLHWRKPARVFVNSMSDLFHEALSDAAIDSVFAVIAHAVVGRGHTFQVLTKRAERMRRYFAAEDLYDRWLTAINPVRGRWSGLPIGPGLSDPRRFPLPNVWLGVSVEDQRTADERIPLLLQTPAAKRFVSYEPAIGPADLSRWMWPVLEGWPAPYRSVREAREAGAKTTRSRQALVSAASVFLDWVIVGGESGPGARPFDLAWARSVVRQCREAGVPCFYKQGGASNRCEHSAKGGHFDCFPPDLRVREFPL